MEQLRAAQRRQASRARHQQHSSDQRSRRLASYGHHVAGRVGHCAAAQGISAVREASLKSLKGAENEPFCVFLFAPVGEAYSRMFAPEYGIAEDPATGSSTGPLAAYMIRHKLVSGQPGTRFISKQGTKMGRRSLLHVEVRGEDDGIYIGGHVTPVAEAVMTLESFEGELCRAE